MSKKSPPPLSPLNKKSEGSTSNPASSKKDTKGLKKANSKREPLKTTGTVNLASLMPFVKKEVKKGLPKPKNRT